MLLILLACYTRPIFLSRLVRETEGKLSPFDQVEYYRFFNVFTAFQPTNWSILWIWRLIQLLVERNSEHLWSYSISRLEDFLVRRYFVLVIMTKFVITIRKTVLDKHSLERLLASRKCIWHEQRRLFKILKTHNDIEERPSEFIILA